MTRPSGYLHRGRIPDRVIDLLDMDGGWLTAPGIAADLGVSEGTVRQAVYRLRLKGFLAERVVEMACALRVRRTVETRREYRLISGLSTYQNVSDASYGDLDDVG